MGLPFSDETLDLLDRAQRAIDRAIELRNERAGCLERARRSNLSIELHIYRARAASLSKPLTK